MSSVVFCFLCFAFSGPFSSRLVHTTILKWIEYGVDKEFIRVSFKDNILSTQVTI